MSGDLERLAADLAYAAGPGAHQIQDTTESEGKSRAQLGLSLPHGRVGLIVAGGKAAGAFAQNQNVTLASGLDTVQIAGEMAVHAADEGVQMIVGRQQ